MSYTIGDYILKEVIGQGSFASVKVAEHKITHTQVAVKIIPRHNIGDPDHVARFKREVDLIKDLDHPFIAEFFEVLEDQENFYIIMEYVQNGNMLNYVNVNGELNEDQARHYFCQLISVLEYLHDVKKIAHRDLKAENVLLDVHNNIRLIDFGLSNTFSNETSFLKTACGSPAYASPEMIKGEPYTVSSDYWSIGILLYAMVVGELPFEDDNVPRLLQKIIKTQPKFPSTMSIQLKDMLMHLLEKDPRKRITLKKIKEHPWFSQYEYMVINDNTSWRINPTGIRAEASSGNDSILLGRNRLLSANKNGGSTQDPVDREIVQRMTDLGIDCFSLVSEILCDQVSPVTAVYRMLRKEKITDMVGETLEQLFGSGVPQPDYRFGIRNYARRSSVQATVTKRKSGVPLGGSHPDNMAHQPKFKPLPPPIPINQMDASQPSANARSPRVKIMNRKNVSLSARMPFEVALQIGEKVDSDQNPIADSESNEVNDSNEVGEENPVETNNPGITPLLQCGSANKKTVKKPSIGISPIMQRKRKASVNSNQNLTKVKSLNIY